MELAFQIVPVWRDVHIPGEGRFSQRVGKEPQPHGAVVLGPLASPHWTENRAICSIVDFFSSPEKRTELEKLGRSSFLAVGLIKGSQFQAAVAPRPCNFFPDPMVPVELLLGGGDVGSVKPVGQRLGCVNVLHRLRYRSPLSAIELDSFVRRLAELSSTSYFFSVFF